METPIFSEFIKTQTAIFEDRFINSKDLAPVNDAMFILSKPENTFYTAGTRHNYVKWRVESPFKLASKIFPYPLPYTAEINKFEGRDDYHVNTTIYPNVSVYCATLEEAKQWAARMLCAEYQGLVLTTPIGERVFYTYK